MKDIKLILEMAISLFPQSACQILPQHTSRKILDLLKMAVNWLEGYAYETPPEYIVPRLEDLPPPRAIIFPPDTTTEKNNRTHPKGAERLDKKIIETIRNMIAQGMTTKHILKELDGQASRTKITQIRKTMQLEAMQKSFHTSYGTTYTTYTDSDGKKLTFKGTDPYTHAIQFYTAQVRPTGEGL